MLNEYDIQQAIDLLEETNEIDLEFWRKMNSMAFELEIFDKKKLRENYRLISLYGLTKNTDILVPVCLSWIEDDTHVSFTITPNNCVIEVGSEEDEEIISYSGSHINTPMAMALAVLNYWWEELY